MLVDENIEAKLVGYLSAVEGEPGFVIPLFQRRNSNMLLVQEAALDESVYGFRPVEPRHMQQLDNISIFQKIGLPVLWGFRDKSGATFFADRETLGRSLAAQLRDIDQPFLKLQVAQFCEDSAQLVGAWRKAFHHLAERSPRSADAWRDVVIIPTQMRLAVEHAVLAHGLDASVERLGRTVEVAVESSRLVLRLDQSLHAAFAANAAARTTLERSAAPIREAFSLRPGRISLTSMESPVDRQPPSLSEWGGVAVVALGDMATSLMYHAMPMQLRDVPPRYGRPHAFMPRSNIRMLLIEHGQLLRDEPIFEKTVPMIGDDAGIVLVIFQINEYATHLIEKAISLAKDNRGRKRKVVAVIPHLPDDFDDDSEAISSILQTLSEYFDAVWALSDRSPNTKQALPFGPARSTPAAAAHFQHLLNFAQSDRLTSKVDYGDRRRPSLSVIGSAVGDRSAPRLVDHAMMRLTHHLFDFTSVSAVDISSGSLDDEYDVVRDIIHRDAPDAEIEISEVRRRPGPPRVTLALRDVRLLRSGPAGFERFCLERLRRSGWVKAQETLPNLEVSAIMSHRELKGIAIECKLTLGRHLESAIRSRHRRRQMKDMALLTNAMITRRAFALQVLNGCVPFHYSRIDAMYRIYRRRYAYVLTYLSKERGDILRMLVPAVLDAINLGEMPGSDIVLNELGRAKARADETPNFMIYSDRLIVHLPLEFTRKAQKSSSIRGEARIVIGVDGWQLESLRPTI